MSPPFSTFTHIHTLMFKPHHDRDLSSPAYKRTFQIGLVAVISLVVVGSFASWARAPPVTLRRQDKFAASAPFVISAWGSMREEARRRQPLAQLMDACTHALTANPGTFAISAPYFGVMQQLLCVRQEGGRVGFLVNAGMEDEISNSSSALADVEVADTLLCGLSSPVFAARVPRFLAAVSYDPQSMQLVRSEFRDGDAFIVYLLLRLQAGIWPCPTPYALNRTLALL